MSRYDGLIIPRSYNEYINKSDPLTLAQALQQNNVLSGAVAAGDNKAVKSDAVNTALTYQMGTDCNACIPSAANKEAVFVLSNTASNLPRGESANQITFLLESKYSAGTTLGLYRIAQVLYCHSNPMREYLRRGYSLDNGATWTFNDWEKVITYTELNCPWLWVAAAGPTQTYITVDYQLTPGALSEDSFGIEFLEYDGFKYFIILNSADGYPVYSFDTRTFMPYIGGVAIDRANNKFYLQFSGYRGFYFSTGAKILNITTSTTAPAGVTFNPVIFHAN